MEDAVLYWLPFDSICLLFFSIHAYGWHSDTRAMFFPPRCWMQCRKSLFCIPTHMPEYNHLNYIFIELQKLTWIFFVVIWCWKYRAGFLLHCHPERFFDHSSLMVVMTRMWCPFACFQKHFQTSLISFLVLKHHLHLSLHGKKNRLVLSTLLEKTSGSPWRRRSTPLSCSMHHVSEYLSTWMGFVNPTVHEILN